MIEKKSERNIPFSSMRDTIEYSKMGRCAIYVAIKKGKLKAKKVGRRWEITPALIDQYKAKKFVREYKTEDGELVYSSERGTFSANQACKIISCNLKKEYSLNKIYYYIHTGAIKAYRYGKAWVIPKKEIIKICKMEMKEDPQQILFA